MNTYKTSDGERVTQSQIESRMRKAKEQLIQNQLDEFGYNFCTECHRNDCKPVDCAHIVSVQEAKNSGQTELCWSIENMELKGRNCHKKQDGLDLKFSL